MKSIFHLLTLSSLSYIFKYVILALIDMTYIIEYLISIIPAAFIYMQPMYMLPTQGGQGNQVGGGQGAVPIQGVQLIVSDGKGNLTDKESLSLGGQPLAATATNPFSGHYGTYTIDSDCTGTAFLTNAKFICPSSPDSCPNANTVSLAFVIDKVGKKVRMVGVPPYDSGGIQRVVTSIGEKLDAEEHSDDRDRRY